MFNENELQAIITLLQRVDLKGNEALAVANLQIKINQLLQPKEEIAPPEAATNNAPKPDVKEDKKEKV